MCTTKLKGFFFFRVFCSLFLIVLPNPPTPSSQEGSCQAHDLDNLVRTPRKNRYSSGDDVMMFYDSTLHIIPPRYVFFPFSFAAGLSRLLQHRPQSSPLFVPYSFGLRTGLILPFPPELNEHHNSPGSVLRQHATRLVTHGGKVACG